MKRRYFISANLDDLEADHPLLIDAGTGTATPRWIVIGEQNVKNFTSTTFPRFLPLRLNYEIL